MLRFLFFLFLMCSCGKSINTTEKAIIKSEKFTKLIIDLHLIEAKFETIKFKDELIAQSILQSDYDSIFNLHKITYEDFKKSLEYYSLKENQLELIYTNALEEIKKKNSKLN